MRRSLRHKLLVRLVSKALISLGISWNWEGWFDIGLLSSLIKLTLKKP